MGKELSDTKRPSGPSHIPVISSWPSPVHIPTSASGPYLGFTSPTGRLAVSDSPSHPSLSPPPASGGLSPFRSFRNLLSFGPSKGQSTSAVGPSRSSFAGLRRPTHGDRSVSTPNLRHKSQDDLPVLSIELFPSIELSHRVDEPLIDSMELHTRLGLQLPTPDSESPSSSRASSVHADDHPVALATTVGISDLSTILEAETSGMSKQFSSAENSRDMSYPPSPNTPGTADSRHLMAADLSDRSVARPSRGSNETSALDLSTSMVPTEVLAAMSGPDRADGWVHGVVLDGLAESPGEVTAADPNISFNLDALDPDLAALLSPYRMTPELASSPRLTLMSDIQRQPKREFSSKIGSPSSSVPSPSSQSSPRRSASLARPGIPRLASSTVSRLVRSASERPAAPTTEKDKSPSSSPIRRTPSPRIFEPIAERQSLQLPRRSPLATEIQLPRRPASGGRDAESSRPALSRLATPSRLPAAASSARGLSRHLNASASSPGWDVGDSVSSRSPSVAGSVISKRLSPHRPSFDSVPEERPRVRTRVRSSSLTESSPYHPAALRSTDWLGPRTAKAFAAAGLLDRDRNPNGPNSRPGSRFGTTRSERDTRSHYAPSRMGFSEAGSGSSWERRSGSVSHTAMSDLASPPRTVFSAVSTTPTSVSAASSAQKHLQSELQLLQDKHALETGALLNALADSQRTTRLLRDENTELRDKVQSLDDQLTDALNEVHRLQSMRPSIPQRGYFHRPAGRPFPDSTNRTLANSRFHSLSHSNSEFHNNSSTPDHDLQSDCPPTHEHISISLPPTTTESYTDPQSKRYSTSSSVFPALPNNMTMLLDETGVDDRPSQMQHAPPAPPPYLPDDITVKYSLGSYHRRTASSTGNISPTTANFSMITGSPGSLDLRPEHDRLLSDMPTLNLCEEDYELDAFNDLGR
ncbi:hypothetical protein PHLCEN_2v12501 [Hermanssonia centrifuga]|uniref:Uncharacterized protein n=1 Tax=Hermanssonia centrifuga TaxID=98765 RepID=A0A2R6NHB8_9APHY|nr:hypothetical protein PHLCEN_2v12501 [Hermanssonia centrifuga]